MTPSVSILDLAPSDDARIEGSFREPRNVTGRRGAVVVDRFAVADALLRG